MTSDQPFLATALIGPNSLSDGDIQAAELARARHALAYLKARLGNETLRALLQADLAEMAAQVHGWVAASGGRGRRAWSS